MTETQEQLLNICKSDFEKLKDLPFAVYITAEDGTILESNQEFRNLFHFDEKEIGKKNIIDYFLYKEERKQIIKKLQNTPNREWHKNEILHFKIHDKIKSIRFYIQVFKDEAHYLGAISIAFEISDLEGFKELENTMPIGVFEINKDRKISYANPELLSIFGFNEEDIESVVVPNYFQRHEEFDDLIEILMTGKSITNEPITLKKKDGSWLKALVSIVPNIDLNEGKLWGVKGIIKDISYDEILRLLPISLFMVAKNSNGKEVIIAANQAYAEFHGLENPKDCLGLEILNFYPNGDRYDKVMKDIKDKFDKSLPLSNYDTTILNQQGVEKHIILNVSPIIRYGHIEGRVGAILDITDDIDRELVVMREDFGGFLHTYNSVLVSLRSLLLAIIKSHGIGVIINAKEVNIDLSFYKINEHLKGLSSTLEYILSKNFELQMFNSDQVIIIKNSLERTYAQDNKPSRYRAAWIRENIIAIRDEILKIHRLPVSKENIKKILFDISEILRFTSMVVLSIGLQEIREMIIEISTFKEALFSKEKSGEKFRRLNICNILEQVINGLTELARSKGIEFKLVNFSTPIYVNGINREIYTALYNVIHNSIKYSWTKAKEKFTYVEIILEADWRIVKIKIQNRGVPIRKEELQNKIFSYGYRGISSSDKDRTGSGVGLWHAKKIIRDHNGNIIIESNPIQGNRPDDYKNPFITTATITLPISLSL